MSVKPLITIREAADIAGMSVVTLRRFLKARAHIEPGLLVRAEGERIWRVQREALRKVLGATDEDLRSKVERNSRRIEACEADIKGLKRQVAGI